MQEVLCEKEAALLCILPFFKQHNINTSYRVIFSCTYTPFRIRTSESTLLHSYLSHALGVPLKDGRLVPVDQSQYLLTLDNTIKMLQIHER